MPSMHVSTDTATPANANISVGESQDARTRPGLHACLRTTERTSTACMVAAAGGAQQAQVHAGILWPEPLQKHRVS